jgi:hypothetical protein
MVSPDFKVSKYREISCQIRNYQFPFDYCRYNLDILTISYQEIRCQIEIMKMGF